MLSSRIEKQIPTDNAPLMAFTSEGGVVPKGERYDRSYLVKNDEKLYKKTEYNDFIYSSNNLDVGSIGLNKYGTAVISDVYEIFSVKGTTTPTFISELIQRPHILSKILKYRQGCLYGQYRIYAEDFLNVFVKVPTIKEQLKIASFLDVLDKRIALQEQLVKALKKYKRGLSDALFEVIAQNQNVNEYRFENIMELLQNNTFSRDELIPEGDGIKNIHYGDILIKYGASIDIHKDKIPVIKSDISVKKYSFKSYLKNGDVVFADTAEDYAVGKATEIVNTEGHQILSGLHTIPCRPKKHFAPMFLGYYFNSSLYRTQIYPIIQGTKVSSISKSEIVKTKIIVPPELMQKQIASILYAIDIRIDAAEKQKEAFDNLRYGLLQQLFI